MNTNNDKDENLLQLKLSDEEEADLLQAFQRIDTPLPDIDTEWERVSDGIGHRRPAVVRVLWVAAAAACVALLLVLVPRFHSPADRYAASTPHHDSATVSRVAVGHDASGTATGAVESQTVPAPAKTLTAETGRGEDRNVTLPDGSTVWLNAGSRLVYPSRFDGDRRVVYIHGEGYFEVTHDERHPFVVESDYFTTTVLGTVFNVNTYSRKDASLVLIKGKVTVCTNGSSTQYIVMPGQKAVCDGQGQWSVSRVNTYPYTQHKDGFFYFDHASLHDIMAEIGRWYGKTVVFEDNSLARLRLHFVAERSDRLESVIESLNRMDSVEVAVENGVIVVR